MLRKLAILVFAGLFITTISGAAIAKNEGNNGNNCSNIQSGLIRDYNEQEIKTGYDNWGYNYQAHIFNGNYCDAYFDADWCQAYKDVNLIMKWSDAFLGNKDCNSDNRLDRHYGFYSFINSGAWITNHQSGMYEQNGNICLWNYFVKIAAIPEDAFQCDNMWYDYDGKEIGPVIWDYFAIIQEVINDPCTGMHGLAYKSPVGFKPSVYKPSE